MRGIKQIQNRYSGFRVFSFLLLSMLIVTSPARSHEIEPSIVDVAVTEDSLTLSIDLSLEAVLAEIDLSQDANTANSKNEVVYDELRQLQPDELEQLFQDNWVNLKDNYHLIINDIRRELDLISVETPVLENLELSRNSTITIAAQIPPQATDFQFGWEASLGLMVLRRPEGDGGFAGYVEPGDLSPRLPLINVEAKSNLRVFIDFIPVGFDHILPKGLDHILFVIGLFLFSARWKPLLWQVSAFTVAHTITLALASLGVVTVSPRIVEPLIAISIAYVAIENIFTSRMAPWRPALIFAFGLLHGLGFTSVLSDFGLPGAGLVYALVGFNIGVEIGQLVVIALCFALVGYWFRNASWYRARVTIPASALIAVTGLWWTIERTLL